MAEMVDLISLWPGADRDLVVHDLRAAALAAGGEAIFLAGSLPAGRNAGDLIMRLRFAGRARPLSFSPALAAAIALRDGAIYDIAQHGGASPQRGLFRTALFAATRRPTAARVATFEAETVAMAGRIAAIRRWALGRVTESWGRHRWTHVWEQTYDGLEGLTGAYMHAPCHWGQVDRWFDTEAPDWLVDPGLCHAFCQAEPLPAF